MEPQVARFALAAAILASFSLCCVLAAPTTGSPSAAAANTTDDEDHCGPKDFFYWEGSDCTKFIKCKNGNITLHTCADGKFWNHEKAKCDPKQNVTGCAPDGTYLVNLADPANKPVANKESLKPKPANMEVPKPAEMNESSAEAQDGEHKEETGVAGHAHEDAATNAEAEEARIRDRIRDGADRVADKLRRTGDRIDRINDAFGPSGGRRPNGGRTPGGGGRPGQNGGGRRPGQGGGGGGGGRRPGQGGGGRRPPPKRRLEGAEAGDEANNGEEAGVEGEQEDTNGEEANEEHGDEHQQSGDSTQNQESHQDQGHQDQGHSDGSSH